MISHYIDSILTYAQSGSEFMKDYVYIIAFLGALFESTPILGTFIPGSLIIIFLGYVASMHFANLALIILSATIGSIIGELIGYAMGRYGSHWMVEHKKILKIGHIEQGRAFFSKHGGKSILAARFASMVRPIVPLIAGSIHMRLSTFIFWNILGAFIWSTVFAVIGFFFGAYAHQIQHVINRAGLALGVILIVVLVVWYYFKKPTKVQ